MGSSFSRAMGRLVVGGLWSVWAFGSAVGCGGQNSSGGDNGACGEAFDTLVAPCAVQGFPASALAHERSRFVADCVAAIALPGAGLTAGVLDACTNAVKALHTSACVLETSNAPSACTFPRGSLPGGAACEDTGQCQSASCVRADDGGTVVPACGVCASVIAEGQPCSIVGGSGSCASGTACDYTATTPTCQPIVMGGVGATCNYGPAECQTGLYCDSSTMQCAALKSSGSSCQPGQCASPLVCLQTTSTCGPAGTTGAACATSSDCDSGFTCNGLQCTPIVWTSPGQPCGGAAVCISGFCPTVLTTGASNNNPTCPTVIADGQPCDRSDPTTTCDIESNCYGGVCVLDDGTSCH